VIEFRVLNEPLKIFALFAEGSLVATWARDEQWFFRYAGYLEALPLLIDYASEFDVPEKGVLLRRLLEDL